jgi:hypothetical protein
MANVKRQSRRGDEWNLTDVIEYKDFIFAVCTFVDEFKRADNKTRVGMIKDPPKWSEEQKEKVCRLAGIAHKLANDYGIDVPAWVLMPEYKMPQPVYAFNTKRKSYQELLLAETPYEFASKNLYIGANAIDRA